MNFNPLSVLRVTKMYTNNFYHLDTREKMDIAIIEEGFKHYAVIPDTLAKARLLTIDISKAGYVFCPGGGFTTPEDAIICALI